MARRTVQHEAVEYLISDDDALAPERMWWAVLRTRAVDEITGVPPRVPLTITTTTPRCTPRADGDGNCGLVARPADVAAALTTPGALTAEIRAQGFLPRSLTAAIDAARRQLPGGANVGDPQLTVTPVDAPATPSDVMTRAQFRPGRGVSMARPAPAQSEEFTTVSNPVPLPAAADVPLTDRVRAARAANSRVAGVPIVLAEQTLHRAARAELRGRARRQVVANGAPDPAPGANVAIGGVWWTQPEVRANSTPPHAPNFVSFAAPLAFDHPAAATVQHCTLTPDATARRLAAPTVAAAREIQLLNWSGLNVLGGEVLQLERDNSNERELLILDAFVPPADAANPARIALRTPLAFPHAQDCTALLVSVAIAGASTLEREAQRGDRVLFAMSLASVPGVAVLRIATGTATEELRFVRRVPTFAGGSFSFPVTLQPDGKFSLPAIARVAQLRLRVEHAGQSSQDIDLALDYGGDNTLDILLKP